LLGNLGGTEQSGISTDGGRTMTLFGTRPWVGDGGAIAASNSGNYCVFPGQNYWPRYTTDDGATWPYCTFTGFTQIANGTENGWGFGSLTTRRYCVCADKQNPGVFYAYNYGAPSNANSKGLWKSTDGGANFTRINSTSIIAAGIAGFHLILRMDRGIMYLIPGPSGSDYNGDATNLSYRSSNGGINWTVLGQLYEINNFAIGAPAPGATNHTLYASGWKSGVMGYFRSLDLGATWTMLTDNPLEISNTRVLAADPNVFDHVMAGYEGRGFDEATYSYKLRLRAT
jgi:hypothetical protein